MKDADERKNELIEIGTEMYLEKNDINVKEIVKKANVAVGLFYYYFESKEIYIGEIINRIINKNLKSLKDVLEKDELMAIEKVDKCLDLLCEHIKETNKYVDLSLFKTNSHYALTEKMAEDLTPYIEKVIKQGIKEKTFKVNDVKITSTFILYGIIGIINSKVNIKNDNTYKEIKQIIYNNLEVRNENN